MSYEGSEGYDCNANEDKKVELVLTANELVIINNALQHLRYDEDAMNNLFCDDCSDLVMKLHEDVGREIKLLTGVK